MKILLLSDPSNPHTIRWANSLQERGIDVFLFGLSKFDTSPYNPEIKMDSLNTPAFVKNKLNGNFLKSIYLLKLPALKKVIKSFKPDILHSHYTASYGFLGSLSGFHPFINSIWGIDIYIFPKVSFIHKNIIQYALSKADAITSTSKMMAVEAKKYSNKDITVIPFGIDLEMLKPVKVKSLFDENDIVIGTVKQLEHKYGLEYLMKAFKLLKDKLKNISLKLLIVGSGSMESKLKKLSEDLNINNQTVFTGKIPHNKIVEYHNMMDIEVYLSDYESFGVSIIEASACEKPVVVSNVGGLPEVVDDGKTGFIVPPANPQKAAEAIEKLIVNINLREKFGKAGREKVSSLFRWDYNVNQMIDFYDLVLKSYNNKS